MSDVMIVFTITFGSILLVLWMFWCALALDALRDWWKGPRR